MRLLMRETRKGSPDGTTVNTYQEGRTYNVPASLAEVFLREGWAEKPSHPAEAREKKITPPEETKGEASFTVAELMDMHTQAELYDMAQDLDITGRGSMSKQELAEAICKAE